MEHLLQQAHQPCVLAHSETQRERLDLLVLQTAGIELGPEVHLEPPVLLLRKLKLRHTALELEGRQEEDRQEDIINKYSSCC